MTLSYLLPYILRTVIMEVVIIIIMETAHTHTQKISFAAFERDNNINKETKSAGAAMMSMNEMEGYE